jgi:hypothetical protein
MDCEEIMMTVAETAQGTESPREVACMFCGSRTPAPAPRSARKSARHSHSANFQVSIVRCRVCGKEAPYQFPNPETYREEAKAAGAV